MPRIRSLWRNLVHRGAADADLDEELRATFDLFVDEQIAAGVTPHEARRNATIRLERMASIKTEVVQTRTGAGLDSFWQDLRFGSRLLRRSPLFTFTALLSLAIGIGATTTIFSLVNALLLRDVQVAAPRQLVELWRTTQFGSGTAFSYPAYERLRDGNAVFSGVQAMSKTPMPGSTGSGSRAEGRLVSGKPTAYLYGLNDDPGGVTLSVRTAGEPMAFAAAIRSRVESVASVPISQARSLASQVGRSLVNERLIARLLSAFAILALILAAVGLYGVLGYSVERRTGEIGLRLTLGATRAGVLRSVLRQSAVVVAVGSSVGVAATQLLARPLSGLLYGVDTSDPGVLALSAGCLFIVAMAAAAIPAWRAARVDPLVALRHE